MSAGSACQKGVAGGAADGPVIFEEVCARCHGPEGSPDLATIERLGVKNLSDPELHARLSDADIRDQIVNGSDNNKMPAFKDALTDEQLKAVIQHVRTLRRDQPLPPPK